MFFVLVNRLLCLSFKPMDFDEMKVKNLLFSRKLYLAPMG